MHGDWLARPTFPVEVTLQCNASEPFILSIFRGLAVSEADSLAHFESGAYSRMAKFGTCCIAIRLCEVPLTPCLGLADGTNNALPYFHFERHLLGV
jgi:hypothetical protein